MNERVMVHNAHGEWASHEEDDFDLLGLKFANFGDSAEDTDELGKKIWEAMKSVPLGETVVYRDRLIMRVMRTDKMLSQIDPTLPV